MRNAKRITVLGAVIAIFVVQSARAEVEIKLSKMHLCCGACVKAVEGALEKVEGATIKVDADAGTAVLTTPDTKTARQALASISNAGFHAESDHKKLKMPENSGVKEGKVERLELEGIHNCCGECNKAVKKAIATVDGVVSDTAKSKSKSLVIEGNFDGLAVVQALNKAGFHVTAKGVREDRKKAATEKAATEKPAKSAPEKADK